MSDLGKNFEDLDDAEKVKFVEAENAATLARLDKLLRDLDDLGAHVQDPDGLISFSLGFDRRLLDLRIADGIGQVMTNLALEQRLNDLFAAGTAGVDEMHAEIWLDGDDSGAD